MSTSKYFDRIAIAVTAITLVITVLVMNSAYITAEVVVHTLGYENRLFDNTRVHTIDIVMNDWDEFIENAASEEYSAANVIVDGESYKNVAIRAKGNTSLSTVSTLGSQRYSFKIEFDHYDKTKTYHGLDKLSLNNLIQDSTMMKDYLTYTLMNEFGVNSSLCSFSYITVNGEDWGLYLAVEGVEESFLQRNYGSDYGELYKPDSMNFGGGRGNGKDFDMGNFSFDDIKENFDFDSVKDSFEGKANLSDMPEGFDPSAANDGKKGGFGGGMGSSDVKLQYIDDDIDSYSNIWDNAKTDVSKSDKERLISSLKKLSENEDIASVVDTEQVIRYFVVHNFVCNGDSYTGSMVHNYYLYEKDGKTALIPWDYNLAFGTFQGGNADSTVNTPIDSPVDNGSGEDRPMWYWIVSNEKYRQQYHEYFEEFLENAKIDEIIDNAYALIKEYVAEDPTAFYSYDEFELGVKTLRKFCELRSESILKQLENGETENNMGYADASDITLSDMGSMGTNKGGFGENRQNVPSIPSAQNVPQTPNGKGEFDNSESDTDSIFDPAESKSDSSIKSLSLSASDDKGAQGSNPGNMPGNFDPSNMPGDFDPSNMPSDFDPSNMPGGAGFPGQSPDGTNNSAVPEKPSENTNGSQPETAGESEGTKQNESTGEEATDEETDAKSNTAAESGAENPSSGDNKKPSGNSKFDPISRTSDAKAWILIFVSVIILGIGLTIAKFRF